MMKKLRFCLLFWGLVFSIASFALSKDSVRAVTLVSYEQGFMDSEGTLALKNNTSQAIYNVTFRLTYQDMKGRELDYEDYSLNVNIEPGLTKKVDVEAYEHDRDYSYYKSESSPLGAHRFKVKFELLDYNKSHTKVGNAKLDEEGESTVDNRKDNDDSITIGALSSVLFLLFLGLILAIYIGIYVLVASMARARHRNVAFWVIASFFGTPFIVVIILWFIGDAVMGNKRLF